MPLEYFENPDVWPVSGPVRGQLQNGRAKKMLLEHTLLTRELASSISLMKGNKMSFKTFMVPAILLNAQASSCFPVGPCL